MNLSPLQFRNPGLLQVVVSALASSGLRPDRLELEITETVLLQEGEATLRFAILLDDPDQQLRPGLIAADFVLFPRGQRESTASVLIRYEVVP